jgi:hypothetical protein
MAGKPRAAAGGDRLSQLMVELRGGLSQRAVAQRAASHLPPGVTLTQPKIAKAELGQFPLTDDQADAFARACGATAAQRRELVELARTYADSQIRSRASLQRNAATIQRRIARLERESRLIRGWQDSIVIGVVQTPEYRAEVVGRNPGAKWLAERETRHQQFREGGREWRLIMYEGALRWALGSSEVMAAQMRHLIEVSGWPGVAIGIVDQRAVKPFPAPSGAFHLYDSRMALSATEVGTTFLSDPADIAAYERQFAALEAIALTADDARSLLERLANDYDSATS